MKKKLNYFLAFITLFLSVSAAFASGGNTSVDILKSDISPLAMGMGGAYAAAGEGALSAYYNPAAVGNLQNPDVSFSYSGGFDKASVNFLAFATPLPYKGFAQLDKGVAAFSFHQSSLGDFTYRYIASDGSIFSKKFDAEKNMIFSLSYAEKAAEGETVIDKHKIFLEHYMGVTVKYVKSVLLEEYSAGTPAFDAGYKIVEPEKGLMFGLSVSNLGGKIKYVKESYPLPTVLRAAFAVRTNPTMDHNVLFTAEYDRFTQDNLASAKIGVEYHLQKILNFRAGYRMIEENKGFTLGLGFFLDNVSADFSTSMLDVYSYSAFSLSYRFSSVEIKEKKKVKKIKVTDSEPVQEKKKEIKPVKNNQDKPKQSDDFFLLY
ncbi:MAG: PorV/PorQ family protein [Elusimicrobiota bacterium]